MELIGQGASFGVVERAENLLELLGTDTECQWMWGWSGVNCVTGSGF